jgi:cystathionine beta-synthase
MNNVYENITDMIGHTPLLRLGRSLSDPPPGLWLKETCPDYKAKPLLSTLYAKVEFLNPGGSVKDRIARQMIQDAEADGRLKPGGTIVEATSGNTGAGLAVIAATKGYKCIFVMPDKMSAEKINALRAFGAKVVITPRTAGPKDADYYVNVATRLGKEIPGAFHTNQYFNPGNINGHYKSTGPELWSQIDGQIDCFVCGIGTGGTMSGTAKYLREKNPNIRIVGVDPVGSIYRSVFETGKMPEYKSFLVEGVGEDMIPDSMDLKMLTDVVSIGDEESFAATRMLATREGLLVGGSCGLAFYGALQFLMRWEHRGGKPLRTVVLLPDSGSRYLTKVFNPTWLKGQDLKAHWAGQDMGGPVEYLPTAKKIEGV